MAPPWRRREKATDRSKIDATPPWEVRQRDEPEPTTGPYDVRDAPDDDRPRVDLGALHVPVVARRRSSARRERGAAGRLGDPGQRRWPDAARRVRGSAQRRNLGRRAGRDQRSRSRSQGGSATDEPDGPFGTELRRNAQGTRGLDAGSVRRSRRSALVPARDAGWADCRERHEGGAVRGRIARDRRRSRQRAAAGPGAGSARAAQGGRRSARDWTNLAGR